VRKAVNTSRDVLIRARSDFGLYCSLVYRKFRMPRHIQLLIAHLQDVSAGRVKRLMVSMPPRHGKSLTTTQLFPCSYLGRHPDKNGVIATYSGSLATEFGRKVQRTVTDDMHRAIFPEARLMRGQGAAERFDLELGGSFYATGRDGSLTGRGADLLIIDDLIKDAQEARSPSVQRACRDFYERVALTRLSPEGSIILVGTRWGRGDLFDYLLEEQKQENWKVINLPAIAEPNDPLGRAEGEALWPEKFSVKHLKGKRVEMGALAFGCLYQGRPAESEGLIFKLEWWQRYSQLPQLKRAILSLDSAFKTGAQNDYSAIQLWGEAETGFYLLHAWKQRVDYPTLKRTLLSFYDQWRPSEVLIEDAASGQSLIQDLRAATSLPVRPVKVDKDKESRAQACTGMLEAGRVFIPAAAPWLDSFLDELGSFPTAAHDDQVDACTMALNHLRGRGDSWLFHLTELFSRPKPSPDIQKPAPHQTPPNRLAPAPGAFLGDGPSDPPTVMVASFDGVLPIVGPLPATREKAPAPPLPSCPACGKPLSVSGLPGIFSDRRELCGGCGFERIVAAVRK
jgi:predicted phage terminase large subunit-like protein